MTASPSTAMPVTLSPTAVVDEFLRLLMIPDPAECAAFNAGRSGTCRRAHRHACPS